MIALGVGGALAAIVAVGAVAFAGKSSKERLLSAADFAGAAVVCNGSAVTLEFDPARRVRARSAGETVAEADFAGQQLDTQACDEQPAPTSFSQAGVHYIRTQRPTILTCRFPGRFLVAVEPVSPSWAGERPAGRNVALVLERRTRPGAGPPGVILAAGTVLERPEESDLVYVGRYCSASSG